MRCTAQVWMTGVTCGLVDEFCWPALSAQLGQNPRLASQSSLKIIIEQYPRLNAIGQDKAVLELRTAPSQYVAFRR